MGYLNSRIGGRIDSSKVGVFVKSIMIICHYKTKVKPNSFRFQDADDIVLISKIEENEIKVKDKDLRINESKTKKTPKINDNKKRKE